MFKKLLKSRHDRKAEAKPPTAYNGSNNQHRRTSSLPDEYGYQVSPFPSESMQPPTSCVPVDYDISPPTPFAGSSVDSPAPYGGVEYHQSPPVQAPPQQQQQYSVAAVEYNQSAPAPPRSPPSPQQVSMAAVDYTQSQPFHEQSSSEQRNVSMAAVEYNQSAPGQSSENATRNARYSYTAYKPPSPAWPAQNNHLPNNEPLHVYPVELPAGSPRIYSPQELSASPAPRRYELPTPSTHRATPVPITPSTVSSSPRSPNSTWSNNHSPNSTPATTPATTPHPPYPYHNNLPRFSLPAQPTAAAPKQAPSSQDQGVIKFTVNVFCQKKSETSLTHEELPRDVREFRLAKVALIPVSAGERRFVSLDIVFGEADKTIAGFLEKHYLITPDSKLERYTDHGVSRDKSVWRIQPLKVAYKGYESLLYVTFRSAEDESKFQADFHRVKALSEHC